MGEREVQPLPAAIGPIVPNLISNVAAEKSARLFAPRILAVEEATGGEVVGLACHLELLVGNECLLWVVL